MKDVCGSDEPTENSQQLFQLIGFDFGDGSPSTGCLLRAGRELSSSIVFLSFLPSLYSIMMTSWC